MAKPIQTKKDPSTVAECEAALEVMEGQFKTTLEGGRSCADEHARNRRNWIAQCEQDIAGKVKTPRTGLLQTHREELSMFEHDAELNKEYNRLYQLRHKLERKEARTERAGRVSVNASGVAWAPTPCFATAIELPEIPEGVPADVRAFFAECVNDVNKAVKKFTPEPSVNVGNLGELDKPVTVKDVEALHAARRAGLVIRVNNAKLYVIAVQAALDKLIAFDAEEVTLAAVASIEAQAQALAADIEAGTVKAGADPDAAKQVAANAPKVVALLASVPNPKNATKAEREVEALLVERGNGAREALGQLLAALG